MDDIDLLAQEDADRPPNEDRLLRLRDSVAEARGLEAAKEATEQVLKDINLKLQDLYFKTLPDLLDEAGVPAITLEATEDGQPAIQATAKPFYRANIAAEWPEERRRAAFSYLEEEGHGDLIKTEVTVQFPRDQRHLATTVISNLRDQGYTPLSKESVSWNTLSAWLKEQVEQGTVPDLDKIGGTVGRKVTLKTLKED